MIMMGLVIFHFILTNDQH